MATKITIRVKDIPGAVGDYVLDPEEPFTNRELHKIKQMSGVRMGEFEDALGAADNDLLIAFTAIALKRAGRDVPDDALWDASTGAVVFVIPDTDDGDADVPPSAEPTELGSSGDGNVRPLRSSEDSTLTGDDPLETALRATGAQA